MASMCGGFGDVFRDECQVSLPLFIETSRMGIVESMSEVHSYIIIYVDERRLPSSSLYILLS